MRLAPALALALALTGCAAPETATTPATGTAPAATTATTTPATTTPPPSSAAVAISGFAFQPATARVAAGGTVTWTNDDASTHTATASGGAFDSGDLAEGGSFSHTFPSAGTFAYRCRLHSSMRGTVEVV